MRRFLIIFIASSSMLLAAALSTQGRYQAMEKAPAGYSWRWVDGEPIALLVPSGWHFYSKEGLGSYVTLEDYVKKKFFKTGFSLFLLKRDISKFETPEKQLSFLLNHVKNEPGTAVISMDIQPESNPLMSSCYRIFYTRKSPYGTVKIKQWFWYHRPSNTIFSCKFESPAAEWNETSVTARVIFQNIFVVSKETPKS